MKFLHQQLQKKLKQYSAVAGPVLASAGMAQAQVVYQDVYPDILYTDLVAGDNYTNPVSLDLDNDGAFDLKFAVWSSVQSNNGPNKVNLAAVQPYGANQNAIMGYTMFFSASICSTPLFLYCPSAVEANQLIDGGGNFWALPSSNNFGTLLRYFRNEPQPYNFLGPWNNVTDRFIGVRFKGGDGLLHYAWVRLDVTRQPVSVTIKDYAYEMQASQPIKAGAMGNVGMNAETADPGIRLYCDGTAVMLELNDVRWNQSLARVYNLAGQCISMQTISSGTTMVNMGITSAGVYMITVQSGADYFSETFTIH